MGKYQRGISMVTALAVVAGAMLIFLTIKLAPSYIDDYYVQDALKFLVKNNPNVNEMDTTEIKAAIDRYTTINTIGAEQAKSFKVHRLKDRMLVDAVYEVRIPMLMNIDVVLSFKNQLDTSQPDKCCKYLIDHEKQKE